MVDFPEEFIGCSYINYEDRMGTHGDKTDNPDYNAQTWWIATNNNGWMGIQKVIIGNMVV